MIKYLLPLLLTSIAGLSDDHSIEITESYFKNIDSSKTPQLQQIEVNYLNTKSNKELLDDKYSFYLVGSGAYGESKEQSLSVNIPVTSNNKAAQIGIQKKTKYGVTVGTQYYTEQYTNNFLTDATTNGVRFDVELDLLKDFLGRTSRSEYEASAVQSKEAKLFKNIQKKQYINELRKAYWDLVATEEAYKVSKTLSVSAKKQLAEQRRKFKSGIGSRGDVARFESLVNDRNTSLIELEATRSQKIQLLKQQIPELVGKEVILGKYDLNKTVEEFFQCTAIIETQKKTPLNYTLFDEILKLKSERLGLQTKALSTISSPELKLVSQFDVLGNDFTYDSAQSELTGDNSSKYSVSLQFQMPIGSSVKNTEELKVKMAKAQISSEMQEMDAKIHTLHKGIVDNLGLLKKVILTRYENQKHMRTVLKDSQKKYRQARISSKNLIDDEDSNLNNDLGLIQTQAQIISIMLDYFSVFTETPCELNRI